jgi:hypothetical protein
VTSRLPSAFETPSVTVGVARDMIERRPRDPWAVRVPSSVEEVDRDPLLLRGPQDVGALPDHDYLVTARERERVEAERLAKERERAWQGRY